MKNIFYIGYLLVMLFVVVAVDAVNLCCNVATGRKPIKWFQL